MAITRPHICEEHIAAADVDDNGNVVVTVYGTGTYAAARRLTPAEARELADELTTAATTADTYRAEQEARP